MAIFNFKRFSVCDDRAAMKVGTDAVLLGAWANVDGARTLLDVGTGSGVIALMLAQRTDEKAIIDAIELQAIDAEQAALNVHNSPWREKVIVHHTRIQDYKPVIRYDVIVCNPPYFADSLKPPGAERTRARHDSELTLQDLSTSAASLLAPSGAFSLILPLNKIDAFVLAATRNGLFLTRLTRFFSRNDKAQERSLMELKHQPAPYQEDSLVLYESGQEWTEKYSNLTGDFYLARHMP
jgi:tRNA1Val (adenine37-N6)-methyltransferase